MWDFIYKVNHYVYGRHANDFLAESVNHLPKGNVLCLADGEGRNSVFLAKLDFNVTAVDISTVALKKSTATGG